MPIRYEDGESFVEYSERWSRGEVSRFWKEEGPAWLDLVGSKIQSCSLLCADGTFLTEPTGLTEKVLEELDFTTWEWFSATTIAVVQELQRMGEAKRRSLFDMPEQAPPSEEDGPAPS